MSSEDELNLADKQVRILELLLDHPYAQKDLAKALGISGAGLFYHLKELYRLKLIDHETIAALGGVKRVNIFINPNVIQRVRGILGIQPRSFTLITGLGKDFNPDEPASNIPNISKKLLEKDGYPINRVVTFVTDDSNINRAKELVEINREVRGTYEDYRNENSPVISGLETLVQEEQKTADLILDLTPLTKLLTIKLLALSHKYKIPSIYLGLNEKKENYIIWINEGKPSS